MTTMNEITRAFDQRFDAARSMSVPLPKEDRHRHSIVELGVGGFFIFEEKTYKVTALNTWSAGGSGSTELTCFCLETGEERFVEWWEDLGLQAIMSVERVDVGDLGIDPDDLDDIASDGKSLTYKRQDYRYSDDYEAAYGEDRKAAYLYSFKADGGKLLSVQYWKAEEDYDGWLSRTINPAGIEVLVPGGKTN